MVYGLTAVRSRSLWPALCLAGLGLLAGGCAHSDKYEAQDKAFSGVYTPHPPAFLNGPAALLLTNATGFSAQVQAQAPGLTTRDETTSGQLLSRGTQLLYAPDPDETTEKRKRPGGFSFIWDVAENRGFVLSEALQAYAPVSSREQVTNMQFSAGQPTQERISGHPCELVQATLQKSDGTNAMFEVARATDRNGIPVRITSGANTPQLTLTLSRIRSQSPPADLFVVPEGFVKYNSPEALADELAARQLNLRRKGHDMDYLRNDEP